MTKSRLIWVGVIVALVALAAVLLMPRTPEVGILTVERAEAVRALAVNGRIRPRQSVEVKTPVSGTLTELPYDVGAQISAGAVLARIDDGPQRAAITEAGAAISTQQAVVAQARRDLARYEALGEFVSRRQVEEARLAVDRGARELQRLRAAQVEAREVQQRYVVRAPFSGMIMERPVDRGQTVSPESVLYRLADLTAPEITAEVDEAYAVELRPGVMATVELAGQQDLLRAEVVHVEPRVDEATGAREVRLRFAEGAVSAPAGQTVSVNLVIERRPEAISIPRASILQPESQPSVRVIDREGRVSEQPIRFIDWPSANVIVTQGLEPGMRLLIDPYSAEPGSKVRPAR